MANPQTHRAEGSAKELGGKVKKKAGEVTGDERMEMEGRSAETRGHAQKEGAKAVERAKGKAQELAGKAKKKIGETFGDRRMQAEGKGREVEGQARRSTNKPS